nr:unnamed protein product [Digitaria exilis]
MRRAVVTSCDWPRAAACGAVRDLGGRVACGSGKATPAASGLGMRGGAVCDQTNEPADGGGRRRRVSRRRDATRPRHNVPRPRVFRATVRGERGEIGTFCRAVRWALHKRWTRLHGCGGRRLRGFDRGERTRRRVPQPRPAAQRRR